MLMNKYGNASWTITASGRLVLTLIREPVDRDIYIELSREQAMALTTDLVNELLHPGTTASATDILHAVQADHERPHKPQP